MKSQSLSEQQKRKPLSRDEWFLRSGETVKRGQDLPQTKLLAMDVIDIRSAKRQRERLLQHIRDNLSNAALAKRYGVHERTIEKVLSRQTHCDIA
jgi:hypothetical protein